MATSEADRIEGEVRRLMAKHAAIPSRGWSTARERSAYHRRIDSLLDAWNDLQALADIGAAS